MAQRLESVLSHISPPTVDSDFHFTVPGSTLSLEQRRQYERDGFIVIRKLVPDADLDKYAERFRDICSGKAPRTPTMIVMRDVSLAKDATARKQPLSEASVTKIQSFEDDEVLFGYCKHPAVTAVASSIIGPNIKSTHTMLINKPPDTGAGSSRHPMHQDLWYFPFRPANRIVGAWTAMQEISAANGCLQVVPGSHKSELYKHGYPEWAASNKAYHGITHLSERMDTRAHGGAIDVVMSRGDVVFFHPLLLHGSSMNTSTGYRKAISVHYAAAECFWVDVTGTLQEEIKHEIEEMAFKRIGGRIDFIDHWKYAARLVRGVDGELRSNTEIVLH